jgi:hypothetical protein
MCREETDRKTQEQIVVQRMSEKARATALNRAYRSKIKTAERLAGYT